MSTTVRNLPLTSSGGGGGGDASAANQAIGNNYLQTIKNRMQGSLLSNVDYDDVQVEYPTDEIENYKYYSITVLQATVEVTYDDSTKANIIRARRI